jgi:hypothetical protein
MLSTVGRLFTQNIGDYFMLSTVRRFIYTKYGGIMYVENCGKIYLHKILRNTVYYSEFGNFVITLIYLYFE